MFCLKGGKGWVVDGSGCGGMVVRVNVCDGGLCKELRWDGDVYVVGKTRWRNRSAERGGDFWWRRGGPH